MSRRIGVSIGVMWVLWLAVGGTAAAGSADTTWLPLATAVERALAQYPSVGVARAVGDQARASVGEAVAAWLPTLSLAASATRYQEPMAVSPIHGFPPAEPLPTFDRTLIQAGLSADYTLFDGGARGARIHLARQQAGAAAAALDGAQQALISRVVATYLDVLGKREVLAAHGRRIQSLLSQQDRIRQLYSVGRAADVEILRIEAALTAGEAERVRVATALDTSERELARLLGSAVDEAGLPGLVPVALADSLLPPRDSLTCEASRFSPAVIQARSQLAAAAAGRVLARGVRWPSLRAVGNYVDRRNEEGYHADEWSAGLVLSYPLFTGGAIKGALARAGATERAAAEQLRLAQMQVAGETDRALGAVNEARARVRSLAAATGRYAEIVRIEELRLETGVGTQTDYLNAEADLLSASASLVEARHAEIAARAELARLSGQLNSDWIARHLENQP
jgi:outer membrane protein